MGTFQESDYIVKTEFTFMCNIHLCTWNSMVSQPGITCFLDVSQLSEKNKNKIDLQFTYLAQ